MAPSSPVQTGRVEDVTLETPEFHKGFIKVIVMPSFSIEDPFHDTVISHGHVYEGQILFIYMLIFMFNSFDVNIQDFG